MCCSLIGWFSCRCHYYRFSPALLFLQELSVLLLTRGVSIVSGLLGLPQVYSSLVRMFLLRCTTAEQLADDTDQKVFTIIVTCTL